MTHPENGKPLWTESRVETLLEEFFRREMPPALRDPEPAPPSARVPQMSASRPAPSVKGRGNSLAGLVMVGFSSLLLLMLALRSWDNSHSPETGPGPAQSTLEDSGDSSSDRDPTEALKHHRRGPIELRSRIQNVGTDEPDSPGETFPELDIEVYPLDREAPGEDKPAKSRPANPERSPMPEENRQLPENAPSGTDPDEAQLEPVLPELGGRV